eukprot:5869746-Amphidinium_carterae.1
MEFTTSAVLRAELTDFQHIWHNLPRDPSQSSWLSASQRLYLGFSGQFADWLTSRTHKQPAQTHWQCQQGLQNGPSPMLQRPAR